MSRIRSIHPGLWTDEAFMSLSAFARLLYIGLWNEAFDDGVFEWKPLTIKARIFPVDSIDVVSLLGELVAADCISERGKYGLIRNFRHYQRPKKPNSSGLLEAQDHAYVGLVPNQSPTGTEISPQMEDGGGVEEEEQESPPKPPEGEGAALFSRLVETYPKSSNTKLDRAEKLFQRLSPADQALAVEQARPFEIQMRAEASSRGRPAWDQAKFTPGLDTWLRDGRFRPPAPAAPATTLPVLRQDDPLIPIIEQIRGKPIIFGTKGTTTVTPAELEQARQRTAA